MRVKEKGLRRVPLLRWVGWDTSFVPTEGPQIAGRWGEKERRRRGNWRVKERRVKGLGLGRLNAGKDGSRGEGRGGVRPG